MQKIFIQIANEKEEISKIFIREKKKKKILQKFGY